MRLNLHVDFCRSINTLCSLGRQLFERNKVTTEDENLLEEGVVSVDFSQYERTRMEEEEEDRIEFSDSD